MGPPPRELLRTVPGLRAQLRLTVALGVGEALATVAQAVLLANAIAIGVTGSDRPIAPVLLGLVAAVLVRAGLAMLNEMRGRSAGRHAVALLREQAVGLALRRAARAAHDRRPGELASGWVHGADAVANYTGRYLPASTVAAITPVVVIVAVAFVDPLSAGVLAFALPIVVLFLILVGFRAQAAAEQRHASLALLGGHLLDVLRGLPVLRAYGREQVQADQVRRAGEHYRKGTMATLREAFLSGFVLEFVAMLGTALVAVACGIRLAGGHMEFAPAIAALVLAPEVFLPLRRLGAEFHASAEAVPLLQELAQAAQAEAGDSVAGAGLTGPAPLNGEPPVPPTDAVPTGPLAPAPASASLDSRNMGPGVPDPARQDLRVTAVTVRHDDRRSPALMSTSLTVPAGSTTVLRGPSGSGKTTLLRLLLGLQRPDAGEVACGGVNLAAVDLPRWHAQIAWIPQHPVLLPASLRENVRFGRDADDAAIQTALEQVGLGPLAAVLPAGLDTPLGDAALPLSAGERRRLGIARALLRDPRLVLVDEPTANLDRITAEQIAGVLTALVGGRTAVIATHDALPPGLADQTVVLGHHPAAVLPPAPAVTG